MLISANELAALLKRVFEGLGYPQGQYEDAAAMAGWLPLHGEDGLDALAWQADPALPATELSAPAPGRLVARCHGRSALDALPSLLDLACLRASRQGRIQLEILDCRDRKCVLKLLADCARKVLGPGAMGRRRCASASPHRLDRKRRRLSELPDGGPAGTRRCGIATLPDADAGYRAPACSRPRGRRRPDRPTGHAGGLRTGRPARAGTRYRGVPDAVATPEPARRSGLGGELGTVAQRRGRSMSL